MHLLEAKAFAAQFNILFLQYRDQNKADERLRKEFREAVQKAFAAADGSN